uniref:CC domain-containing protein n=1 Tax=Caenorhabditis tropicalis TaxID=1561998 RepID=A0A1I7TFP8_9PELO
MNSCRNATLLLFFSLISLGYSDTLASPIYEYLKDLCPNGQLPLTGSKTVKTCANLCPLGALCYKGICCVPAPQCRHPSYRTSTGFPCLPNVKNNCPENSLCVSSSQDGMHICCSSKSIEKSFPKTPKSTSVKIEKPPQKTISSLLSSDSSQICPRSHPIVAHDGRSLVLCKDCVQGVCAKFRTSNVEVCCQNSDDICGQGSQILMDGMVPRDCDKKPCGKGYECSLTPSGLRVCCSLAKCPSGVLARSVCAAGCLKNEKCTEIQNEMWCCPSSEEMTSSRPEFNCRQGGKGTGEKCDPAFPECSQGALCELNREKTAHICCKRFRSRLGNRKTIFPPPFRYTTTTMMPTTTTPEPFPFEVVPNCQDPDSRPLMENGLPYMCLRIGDPCLRAGYTCQESDIDDVFVCCSVQATQLNRLLPPQIPMITLAPPTTTEEPEEEEEVVKQPTCPFSYMPSKNDHQEVQRCLTLFSLDCPFGYTCLPSSTTDSYLCCIRKPAI